MSVCVCVSVHAHHTAATNKKITRSTELGVGIVQNKHISYQKPPTTQHPTLRAHRGQVQDTLEDLTYQPEVASFLLKIGALGHSLLSSRPKWQQFLEFLSILAYF